MKRDIDELFSRVKQIEDLVRFPSVIGHSATAKDLALSIARQAPTAEIAHLVTQLITEVNVLKEPEVPLSPSNVRLSKILWRLRLALEQAMKQLPRAPGS
jgi:hypothetical protein